MYIPLDLPFRNMRTAAQRQDSFPAMFEIKIGNPKHSSAWAWLGRSGAALGVPECGTLPRAQTHPQLASFGSLLTAAVHVVFSPTKLGEY